MNQYQDLFNRFVQKYGRLPTEVDPDYLEMLRMSKYRIVDVPDFSPGKCGNCGASKNDGRQYIDFGLQVDWYGTVYLCGDCLKDISHEMGLFKDIEQSLAEAVTKKETVRDLREQGVHLHEKVTDVFKEFEDFYAGIHSVGDDSTPDSTPSVVPESTTVESGINETKPRVTKSTSGSRRQDVRSLADLLNNTGD
jgi:hypothetical protein